MRIVTSLRKFAAMTPTDSPAPDVLSVASAARELHRSPRTILHWIKAEKIAATKTGPGTAAYVIARSEIERLRQDSAA